MKFNLTFLIVLISTILLFGQNPVQKVDRDNFIGQKIKFLQDNSNTDGYMDFEKKSDDNSWSSYWEFKTKLSYSWLSYTEFKGRTATFIDKYKDLFTLKMDDTGELIYFELLDFREIPNNIGFFSILDSARTKYLYKTYYNTDITDEFAEDTGKYSKLYGPYNVFYTDGNDTSMVNLHITETYGAENGYTYDYQKERVFENIFKSENPFKPLTNLNIEEKFFIDIDKMDNKKPYIHKNLVDKEQIEYNLGYSLDYENKAILTKVEITNGIPKIFLISNYYSDDWIFHSYIKIKIGDITKQTTPVKGKTEVLYSGVVETNYYNLKTDLIILKWIAENYTKEISVRFYGRDYYSDITIPMTEKLAIKETYDLYNLLKTK
jgi:hypothetical protein